MTSKTTTQLVHGDRVKMGNTIKTVRHSTYDQGFAWWVVFTDGTESYGYGSDVWEIAEEAELSPRELAWNEALILHREWEQTLRHNGYEDVHTKMNRRNIQERLSALVAEHGFQGSRVDPMAKWDPSASQDMPVSA